MFADSKLVVESIRTGNTGLGFAILKKSTAPFTLALRSGGYRLCRYTTLSKMRV